METTPPVSAHLIPFTVPLSRCSELYLPGSHVLLWHYAGPARLHGRRGWVIPFQEDMIFHDGYESVQFDRVDDLQLPLRFPATRDHLVREIAKCETCPKCRLSPCGACQGGFLRRPHDLHWASLSPTFGGPSAGISAFVLAVTWERVNAGLGPIRAVYRIGTPLDGAILSRVEALMQGFALLDEEAVTALVPADSWLLHG